MSVTPCVWHPVSFRSLVKNLGWRDRQFQLLLLVWFCMTLICIESGRIADQSTWINVSVPFLGKQAFITFFPPVFICQFMLFTLGFEWAAIPAFLAIWAVCLGHGMSVAGSTFVALGQPVGLAICALIYKAAPLRVDLKTWSSIGAFVAITTAGSMAGVTGSFVWSAATQLNAEQTYALWEGWLLGSIATILILTGPALRVAMPWWLPVRAHLFPPEPRRDSPFILITTIILTAGLMMAAFLTQTSQLSTVRLVEALRDRVPPPVGEAIREAVANWQVCAWSSIAMVVGMTVVGLGHAYWWAARWRRQHDALAAATRRAEAASNVKSLFLAMISHELRTPLNGVLGMTQLLFSTEMTAEQREYLTMADQSGHHLLGLVNNLLDFAKIEAGKVDLLILPFNPRGVVEHTVRLLGPKAASTGLSLTLVVGEDVPEILLGDEDRLRQILLNLIGNAIKFTHRGSVAVRVELTGSGSQPDLNFSVRDTGIGMSPDMLNRLFQPFTQGDSSMTRKYGGTGLGLSICQRLANAMGGSVSVQSTVGEGSLFRVSLPFGVAAQVIGHPAELGLQPIMSR